MKTHEECSEIKGFIQSKVNEFVRGRKEGNHSQWCRKESKGHNVEETAGQWFRVNVR